MKERKRDERDGQSDVDVLRALLWQTSQHELDLRVEPLSYSHVGRNERAVEGRAATR